MAATVALLGCGAAVVSGVGGQSSSGVSTTEDTTTGTTTTTTSSPTAPLTREPGEDVSGPCDEAEHANEPRCTGTGGGQVEDRSHDAGDDRRGRGDDSSGHGGGRDDD
jgi:hypothetical protein